ncbi:major facilitator superfamily domain-containing protein [Ditylenchus destructor]|uniref:Major facilitator superfamily domain-containing protein n=1 Tax=Ditylenchus destructor TaxID=166010 RepID=A0AAD4N6W9_9BILA|nr:major facilitator superfamily domain-containing protein [Ditylenchus destructor]
MDRSQSIVSDIPPKNAEENIFRNKFRFFILILGCFCLTSVFSNMITLNFTIICMDPAKAENLKNNSQPPNYPTYHYSQYDKTILQWAVSISSMIATFPFSWLCSQYGARYVFLVSGVLSAISTGAIPLAASMGFGWFVFVRVFQGIAYACDFAVIGVLCTRWASLRENAKFLGVLTCFSPLSSFLTNSFSGIICESLGWTWAHYLHAIISLALFLAWYIFYTDDPATNRFVTTEELAIIHHNKSEAHKKHERFVPYLEIAKDKVVWAVWLNAFADLFSGFFLFIYAPTYIRKVLKYSTTETGLLGAVVAIIHIPVKMACGFVSDSYNCLPERKKMWIFNSVAVLTPAAIYIYLCYAPSSMPLITVLLFGGVHAALGFNCGGFYKCGALVSRQYAEFVIAFTQFIKCGVFFIAPALVAIFVDDDSNAGQWHIIFFIIAGTLIFANTVFCVYATDKPCEFTNITASNYKRKSSSRA